MTHTYWPRMVIVWALVGASSSAGAENYQVLRQKLDSRGEGYTVLRVWGSHREMGRGMGAALARDIVSGWQDVKNGLGNTNYVLLRGAMGSTTWLPPGIADELEGIVEGVKTVDPQANIDVIDLKIFNTYSDWSYACRSHACWGRYVTSPVRMLSTRRLDYSTPFPKALHHVLCAWEPNDGSVRWVNLAWPGYVTVITGVNAAGTHVSLHDFNSTAQLVAGVVLRSVAARNVLTGMGARPVETHLTWAEAELTARPVATSTFVNYFTPEGRGGVFTCAAGGTCGAPRLPQSDYFFGEVLITTNSQTDGHSVPSGGQFMDTYYRAGSPKDLQSHWELMGHTGLHLMSVAYRGREDMTLWAEGRLTQGQTERIEIEWSNLFSQADGGIPPAQDGGSTDAGLPPPLDGGSTDAGGSGGDGGLGADATQPGGGTPAGCGCNAESTGLAFFVALLAAGRILRGARVSEGKRLLRRSEQR